MNNGVLLNIKSDNTMISGYLDYGDRAITRPPRSHYPLDNIPLELDVPGFGKVKRVPTHFPNDRGLNIIGSLYIPSDQEITCDACVIYLHGNASCQLEGTFLIPFFVPIHVAVFCFDFSGCGKSEGKRISLGYLERNDVAAAITYINVHYSIKNFALWGRSMGAACTFFCLNDEYEIKGAVADSPFSSLPELVNDLAAEIGVPDCLGILSFIVNKLSTKIQESSGFNIFDVMPINEAKEATAPIFIIHGEDDDFIYVKHAHQLYDAYKGTNKTLRIISGQGHNSDRPNNIICEALVFLANCLGKELQISSVDTQINKGGLHFADLDDMIENIETED